jgi:hypothetical protein
VYAFWGFLCIFLVHTKVISILVAFFILAVFYSVVYSGIFEIDSIGKLIGVEGARLLRD